MDSHLLDYRNKHPRCKYCKYHKNEVKGMMLGIPNYWVCKLKDKMLNDWFWDLKGWHCKWFKPEEGSK